MGILEVESYARLWKTLVDLVLIYLAIQLHVLIPWEQHKPADPDIIGCFQKCLNLKALEAGRSNHRKDLLVYIIQFSVTCSLLVG